MLLGAARSEHDLCKAKTLLQLASSVAAGTTSTYNMRFTGIISHAFYDNGRRSACKHQDAATDAVVKELNSATWH